MSENIETRLISCYKTSVSGLSTSENGRIRVSPPTVRSGDQDSIAVICDADNAENIMWYTSKHEEISPQWKK